MPKRKIKEGKPPRRLGRKELLIPPIIVGVVTLFGLAFQYLVPPPNPLDACLKAHNIETFQLFPRVEVIVDGQPKMLPDDIGRSPKDGEECTRPMHTDEVGNKVHIEFVRPIRFTLVDLMKVYSPDNKTITVIDNSTNPTEEETIELDKYNIQYSYYSAENKDCDKTNFDDKDCYTYPELAEFPAFTNDMLARIELTSEE